MLKLLLAFVFSGFFFAKANASYINENLYAPAIRSVAGSALKSKCQNYLNGSSKSCQAMAEAAIRILDVDLSYDQNGNPAILIFKNQSLKLLKDPRLPQFLIYMRQQHFASRISGDHNFSFFKAAQQYFGNEQTSVHWIGLLFQDNNFYHHRNWLRLYSNLPEDVLKDYFAVYDLISVKAVDLNSVFSFYPDSIPQNVRQLFGKKIYYYYLNRILLDLLRQDSDLKSPKLNSAEISVLISKYPLFLNLIYSYHHIYHSSLEALLKPLEPVAVVQDQQVVSNHFVEAYGLQFNNWKNRYFDLYMAFVATYPNYGKVSYRTFSEALMLSPKKVLSADF